MKKSLLTMSIITSTTLLFSINSESDSKKDITIVTAYYDVPSKFPKQTYQQHVQRFLPNLNCNVIIYTDKNNLEWLQALRTNYADKTTFVVSDFADLYFSKSYSSNFWADQHNKDGEKKIHSYQLYIVWAQKVIFLQDSIATNPFKTSKFMWMDIGCIRDTNMVNYLATFPNADKVPQRKIVMESVYAFSPKDPLFDLSHDRMAGGFIAGDISSLSFFINKYFDTFKEYTSRGLFIGKDQYLFNTIYKLHPHMFHLVSARDDASYRFDPWFYIIAYLAK